MAKHLRVLIVEDSEDDALLVIRELKRGGYETTFERVETAEAMTAALEKQVWDIIIADYRLPHFSAPEALELFHQSGLDLPFIVISGTIGEETAVATMKAGAHDYLMKDNLTRLVPAVERELREAGVRKERKRAEEELRESERRYRLLAENANDVIWTVDMNMRPTYMSPSITRLLGYSVEGAMALPMEAVYAPASFETAMKVFAEELAIENMEQKDLFRSRTLELELNRKDGSIVPVEVKFSFIREPDGRPVKILAIARDVTERKRAEERIKHAAEEWRTTFDSITDLISICNKDFRLIRVNKAFADVFKMNPKELIGKPCYEIVHGTNGPVPNCPQKVTIKTKKPATAEFFEPHLGIHLETTTSPIFNEKGEVVASVHVARDITQHKKMEEQLIITDRLASVGELASGIAHELNNPLTSVIGFSQLLLEKDVPDDVKEGVKIIYSEAQRTAQVVKNLLTFARKHDTEKGPVDINSIMEKVLELRAYEQKVSNIQVNTRFAPDLPEIMADYFQLQQVFLNIIINAEHFMIEAHGKGILTITTERVRYIMRASLADDGPGISKENLGHLFDPFFTTKEVGKGTGLGLSICHGIITEHGGRIYAESKLGKGATFVVELPIIIDRKGAVE